MTFEINVNNQEMKFDKYYSFPILRTDDMEDLILAFNFQSEYSGTVVIKLYDNKVEMEEFNLEENIFIVPDYYYYAQGFSFCLYITTDSQIITTNFLNIPIKEVFKCM